MGKGKRKRIFISLLVIIFLFCNSATGLANSKFEEKKNQIEK